MEEAIYKYKNRYKWNYTDRCIGNFMSPYPKVNAQNPQYTCEVIGKEVTDYTFDYLSRKLIASEFLEYCRQELYLIEKVLTENNIVDESAILEEKQMSKN